MDKGKVGCATAPLSNWAHDFKPARMVSLVECCTAMDGTWGMKKEYYPLSLTFARKVAQEMEASKPDTYMTDCSLAALQVQEIRGQKPAHPASLLREAYGLRAEH